MNKKKIITAVLTVLLILCLIPYPINYLDDGGTVIYNAVLYKVIKWHIINPHYDYNDVDSHGKYLGSEPAFLTGIDVYIFPFNFGDKGYWDKDRTSEQS